MTTYYSEPADYAALGYDHRLVAWTDEHGFPRSIVIPLDADPALIESIEAAINEGEYGPFDEADFWTAIAAMAGSHSLS